MRNSKLVGTDYLEQMLNWVAFINSHPQVGISLRQVLDELYALREKVERDETK